MIATWTAQTTSGRRKRGNKRLRRHPHLPSKTKTNASTLEVGEDPLNVVVTVDLHVDEGDSTLPIRTTIDVTTETMTEITEISREITRTVNEVDSKAEDVVEVGQQLLKII